MMKNAWNSIQMHRKCLLRVPRIQRFQFEFTFPMMIFTIFCAQCGPLKCKILRLQLPDKLDGFWWNRSYDFWRSSVARSKQAKNPETLHPNRYAFWVKSSEWKVLSQKLWLHNEERGPMPALGEIFANQILIAIISCDFVFLIIWNWVCFKLIKVD